MYSVVREGFGLVCGCVGSVHCVVGGLGFLLSALFSFSYRLFFFSFFVAFRVSSFCRCSLVVRFQSRLTATPAATAVPQGMLLPSDIGPNLREDQYTARRFRTRDCGHNEHTTTTGIKDNTRHDHLVVLDTRIRLWNSNTPITVPGGVFWLDSNQKKEEESELKKFVF